MKKIIPRSTILQNEKEYFIYAELPGVSKDKLDIQVTEDTLVVHGIPDFNIDESMKSIHKEFDEKAEFERRFILGNKVDKDHIEANLTDGILKLVLAKTAESAGKKVEVK